MFAKLEYSQLLLGWRENKTKTFVLTPEISWTSFCPFRWQNNQDKSLEQKKESLFKTSSWRVQNSIFSKNGLFVSTAIHKSYLNASSITSEDSCFIPKWLHKVDKEPFVVVPDAREDARTAFRKLSLYHSWCSLFPWKMALLRKNYGGEGGAKKVRIVFVT